MSPRSAPIQKAPRTMHAQKRWAKNWCSALCHRRSFFAPRFCSAPKTTSSTGLRPLPGFFPLFPSLVVATPRSHPSFPATSPTRSPPPSQRAPAVREICDLGGPEVRTFKELMQFMLSVIERRRLLVPIPFALAKFQAGFLQLLPKPLLTPDQVELLRGDAVVSEAAKREGRTLEALGI